MKKIATLVFTLITLTACKQTHIETEFMSPKILEATTVSTAFIFETNTTIPQTSIDLTETKDIVTALAEEKPQFEHDWQELYYNELSKHLISTQDKKINVFYLNL